MKKIRVFMASVSVLLALVLLAIPVLSVLAQAPIDTTYIPGSDKWIIPHYTTPVVINTDKNNVTIDPTWGDKQFTVNQKMLTQGDPTIQDMFGGSSQSTGWGNLWVNTNSDTDDSYMPKDTPFDVWMGWERGYFDLSILIKNHVYRGDQYSEDIWAYDSLQIAIGNTLPSVNPDVVRYVYCIARGANPYPVNMSVQYYPLPGKNAPFSSGTEYTVNTSDADHGTTLYQMKIPLAKFGLTDASQWEEGFMFPFSFTIYIYDEGDFTGQWPPGYFMEWASGVFEDDSNKVDTAATITLGGSPPPPLLGDVNSDGKIDTSDARLILQSIVDKVNLTDTQKKAADVNKDGYIDTTDARMVLQFIVKKIEGFSN